MAFAPHTNTDIQRGQDLPLLIGQFAVEGNHFEYARRPADDRAGWAAELPHLVYVGEKVGHLNTRAARVLKTVAYVAIDEDEYGQPILEKWDLRAHRNYPTDWVFAKNAS